MATQRLSATELARLLNSAPQPIYVLDDDLTIVFLNRACQEWLGAAADGLVGRRCAYHGDPAGDGPDAVAAGLCPPPRVLAGQMVVATVARPAEDGKWIERRARFLPFGAGREDVLGIMALVELGEQSLTSVDGDSVRESDVGEPLAGATEPDATVLHEQIRRFRQEAAARYRADRLIGRGPAMRLVQRQVALAAASRSSVLLAGPPGSGRQHLAAVIHYAAEPEKGPAGTLTPLDCALLGPDLLSGVLAAISRASKLGEQALSGTILLHRVDELSAEVQAELAGLLTRRPPVERLIATATESLVELVQKGKFRDDLAALLSTIVIRLPALAQRRGDLPLLAQLFLEDCNAAGARQIGGFTPAALDRLDAYAWPGNLDELAQVVAEAHQRAAGPEIDVADLPERLHWAAQAAAFPRRTEETIVLDEYLGRVERELIRRALARAKGNKTRAARLLGMTRPRLYRRMVQLGLEPGAKDER
jgi:DNA-binding NtrC family response regulator